MEQTHWQGPVFLIVVDNGAITGGSQFFPPLEAPPFGGKHTAFPPSGLADHPLHLTQYQMVMLGLGGFAALGIALIGFVGLPLREDELTTPLGDKLPNILGDGFHAPQIE